MVSSGLAEGEFFATSGTTLGVAKLNVAATSVFAIGVVANDGRLRTIPSVFVNEYSVDSTSFNSPVENRAESGALGAISLVVDSLLFLTVASTGGAFGKRTSWDFGVDVPNVIDGKLILRSCFDFG